jgi:hypothetical protein
MNKTIEELMTGWKTKTDESVRNLKEIGSILNDNETKLFENGKIVS